MKYAIALIALIALPAYAGGFWGGNDDPSVTVNNNPKVSANARQGQDQSQRQATDVRQRVNSVSESTAKANSNSSSSSDSGGNTLVNKPGAVSSVSTGTGGSSEAGGGSAIVDIDASDNQAASSAASVYASRCTNSASAQGMGGGAAIATGDQLCDHMELANRQLLAYQQQVQWCKDAAEACDPPARTEHLAAYNYHIQAANDLVESTEATGLINRISGQIALPAAMLWVLFLL